MRRAELGRRDALSGACPTGRRSTSISTRCSRGEHGDRPVVRARDLRHRPFQADQRHPGSSRGRPGAAGRREGSRRRASCGRERQIFRIGGEEFGIVIPGDGATGVTVAERVRAAVQNEVRGAAPAHALGGRRLVPARRPDPRSALPGRRPPALYAAGAERAQRGLARCLNRGRCGRIARLDGVPQAVVVREFGGPEALVVDDRPELVPAGRGRDRPACRRAQPARPARGRRRMAGVSGAGRAGSDGAGVVRALGAGVSGLARATRSSSSRGWSGATTPACSAPASASSAGRTTARSPSRCACRRRTSSPSPRGSARVGRGAAAGRADRLARALHARRPALRTVRAGARRRRGHVDVRRPVRACRGRARVRHLELGREDRARASSSAPRPASTTARRAGRQAVVERSGGGVDLVIDSAGTWAASAGCVRAGGRVVVFGAPRARPRRSTSAASTSSRSTSSAR